METFCIDSRIIGTEKHFVCSGSGYSWVNNVPNSTWHLSGQIKPNSDWCLDTVFKLSNENPNLSPASNVVDSVNLVLSNHDVTSFNIPWRYFLSSNAHKTFIKNIVDQVSGSINRVSTKYYKETWVPGDDVLRSLVPAKIDIKKWQSLIDDHVGNVHVVKTFKPDVSGFAPPVTYNRFGTLTGRLTVSSGPNILTLKKELRNIIIPDEQDGCIMYVDFAALEARVLLYEAGKRCDAEDLYNSIAIELGYDRKKIKAAVISELYGISKYVLGQTLQVEEKELNKIVSRIKNYFSTEKLLKRIKEQFVKNGFITNRYGRPIVVDEPLDHIFINYYAQSTGVDVTLLGFSKIVNDLKINAPHVKPLYSLHDALLLYVPKIHIDYVESIKTINVPGYVQPYNLKVERLICTE